MTKQKLEQIRYAVTILSNLSNEDWEELYGMIEDPNWNQEIHEVKVENSSKLVDKVSSLIKALGVPANIKGYKCLQSAIIYCMKADHSVGIFKELYPAVAKEIKDTPQRVERAIRHAIELAFKREYNHLHHKIFGDTTKFKTGKPSNGEFITYVAEYLKTN